MKKLLTSLAALGMMSAPVLSIVSCVPPVEYVPEHDFGARQKSVKNNEWQSVPLFNNNSKQIQKTRVAKVEDSLLFNPYADMSILDDTAELLLKEKGVTPQARQKALQSLDGHNALYNDLDEISKQKDVFTENTEITLGYVQNASDTGELIPMWNAGPAFDSNGNKTNGILENTSTQTKFAKRFNDRYTDWTTNGNLESSDFRISFGPYSNSLWHAAYNDNKTPTELATTIANISQKYGTKKFDFYFVSPFLATVGPYHESQVLLASALSILLSNDSSYDFQLTLDMSTKDGVGFVIGTDGKLSETDESSVLYTFTQYLGMNFRLNLDTTTLQDSSNNKIDNWEVLAIKEGVQKTHQNWMKLHKQLNGVQETTESTSRLIKFTNWIGRNKKYTHHDFFINPQDSLELRQFAEEKNYGGIGMLYISRDNPSLASEETMPELYTSNAGYENWTYAKILNGTSVDTNIEEITDPIELEKINAVDYTTDILENQALNNETQWNEWTPSNSGEGPTNGWIMEPKSALGGELIKDWKTANPNREQNSRSNLSKATSSIDFIPYLDAGLETKDAHSSLETYFSGNTKTKSVKLGYIQQSNGVNSYLDLTVSGRDRKSASYAEWEKNELYGNIFDTLIDNNKFKDLVLSFGGPNTSRDINKNPWTLALKITNGDISKATSLLKDAIKNFQSEIQEIAKEYSNNTTIPKNYNLEFDLDGNTLFDSQGIIVLANTLAQLKKENRNWNFTISLPAVPTGLTNISKSVYSSFVVAYQKLGLMITDLPNINLMSMDYGDEIFRKAIGEGKTYFDLMKNSIDNSIKNIQEIISTNTNFTFKLVDLKMKLSVTSMIGINDHRYGVFTEEDAKDLYNYAAELGLNHISMWSINSDTILSDDLNSPLTKNLHNHGLNYLSKYEFSNIFNGNW